MRKYLIFIISFFVLPNCISAQKQISAKRLIQKAGNGQLIKVEANVFYNLSENKIIVNNIYPQKFIMISNIIGEAKIYFQEKNQVMIEQKKIYAADSDLLYFFLTGSASDMGLDEQGYQLIDTKYEDELMITIWSPPALTNQNISQVELVLQNYLPIYFEFKSIEDKVVNKLYFSNYKNISNNMIPMRITEISYVGEKDSIVNRLDYSDIRTGLDVDNYYLDFKIPSDAKIIKNEIIQNK